MVRVDTACEYTFNARAGVLTFGSVSLFGPALIKSTLISASYQIYLTYSSHYVKDTPIVW